MPRFGGGGYGRGGGHRGLGGGFARGPGGECACPNCGYREPHQLGVPCHTKNALNRLKIISDALNYEDVSHANDKDELHHELLMKK